MAPPQTTIAQVQTDSFGSPTPSKTSRPISGTSSGRGSVTPTSSLDGRDSLFESVDHRLSKDSGLHNSGARSLSRHLSRGSDLTGPGRRGLKFSSSSKSSYEGSLATCSTFGFNTVNCCTN